MQRQRPIIVAESDFLTGALLVAALQSNGRVAEAAADGETLLQLIEKEGPELLVLSMNLARPSGVQMLRTLRQKHADMKIIATTRPGQADLRVSARGLGVTAFLELPFSPEELLAQIETLDA